MAEDKSKRYDRQIRIWGASGQRALESCHLCLVNATGLGCEILKNLVLPGIGAFTIVDGAQITPEDTGSNFFLTKSDLGKSRATVVKENMKRHNPFVTGTAVSESAEALLERNAHFFEQFTFIIVTNAPESTSCKFGSFCEEHHIPLMIARTHGFIGHVRLYVPEHTIVDAKPETPQVDLRTADPWAELVEYARTFDNVEEEHREHVPYVCLLINEMARWKAQHEHAPRNLTERKAFKAHLQSISRAKDAIENYDEAIRYAHKACEPVGIPGSVRQVLEDNACINVTAESTPFWILAHALRLFTEQQEGKLPLNGEVPDMVSITPFFVGLQRIFKAKAQRDLNLFKSLVAQTLERLGLPAETISEEERTSFAKNALLIRLMRFNPLSHEYNPATFPTALFTESVGQTSDDPEYLKLQAHNAVLYVMLRLADRFHATHGRYPGVNPAGPSSLPEAQFAEDVAAMRALLNTLGPQLGVASEAITDGYLQETARYTGRELHTMAALVGGIGGQEAFKVISRQFIPINNTLIFNGVQSVIWSAEL
eukprot:gnl/Trimastix_PCT/2709.p1 GENE.gnl/Trimastix_PCT/2709~~gnl/Trimastix_PCT/2709.p1  ORF type:complete len:550 (-),score=150.35 gnl/Trimastix_PCT/2709:120-1742(-)